MASCGMQLVTSQILTLYVGARVRGAVDQVAVSTRRSSAGVYPTRAATSYPLPISLLPEEQAHP